MLTSLTNLQSARPMNLRLELGQQKLHQRFFFGVINFTVKLHWPLVWKQDTWVPNEGSFIASLFPTFQAIKILTALTRPRKPQQKETADDHINCFRVCRLVSGCFPMWPQMSTSYKWKLAESSLSLGAEILIITLRTTLSSIVQLLTFLLRHA